MGGVSIRSAWSAEDDVAGPNNSNTVFVPPKTTNQTPPPTNPLIQGSRSILDQKKEYTLLAPLNYGNTVNTSDIGAVFNVMVYAVIGLGALIAVMRIVYGGFLYVGSEAAGKKGEGKEAIQNAIWGLIMILSVYIILNTINPNLLNLNLNLGDLTEKIKLVRPTSDLGTTGNELANLNLYQSGNNFNEEKQSDPAYRNLPASQKAQQRTEFEKQQRAQFESSCSSRGGKIQIVGNADRPTFLRCIREEPKSQTQTPSQLPSTDGGVGSF